MSRASLTAILYLLLTFASGVAVGGLSHWFYDSRATEQSNTARRMAPEEFRKRYLDEMVTRLGLTADQVVKLEEILDSTAALYDEVAAKHLPEYEAIQQHQTAQIRAILNEQQIQEFEKFRQERERWRRKGPKRPRQP